MPEDKKRTYDAIVIGSGASGGWAAKELCDKGLKTLVLERGRNVEHVKDYPTASKAPWEFDHRGTVSIEQRKNLQGARNLREETLHWALKDDRSCRLSFPLRRLPRCLFPSSLLQACDRPGSPWTLQERPSRYRLG